MFGGVASGDVERGKGFQFLDDNMYNDAVVAAVIESKIISGMGLSYGFTDTGLTFQISQQERRTIAAFVEGSPSAVKQEIDGQVPEPHLLAQFAAIGFKWIGIVSQPMPACISHFPPCV